MATKRKLAAALVAGVTAVTLLVGGTLAWTGISQSALNESAGIVNVGGRLHDDFNGKDKAVYVENFTDGTGGGQPIYARIRLDEYMEVGQDAGGTDDGDGISEVVPVVAGTKIDDVDTWTPHVPSTSCAVCATEGTCKIHDHWEWIMGGSTTFMPTFNKDKDSLDADINGTYHGTTDGDKVYYDDYVVYTTDDTADGVGIDVAEADKESYKGSVYSVTGTARYDNDPDMAINTIEGEYTEQEETHTAKETSDGSVITMAEWRDTYDSAPGNYWVYDTDGWAYWANPIMPGEATGLLLQGIEMTKNPGEKCYYAINVVGQFATAGDWTKFGVDEESEDYPSDDALEVLTTASQNVPVVTVTLLGDKTLLSRGDTANFSASTTVGVVSTLADDEYDWVVLDVDRKVTTTSTVKVNADGTATLTVGDEEMNPGLYVAARSRNHGGAVGLGAVAVRLYNVSVSAENETVNAGKTLQFDATVVDNSTGETDTSGVTWSVDGGTGTTAISETGLLTLDANEIDGAELTVTAVSKNGGFIGTRTVTAVNTYTVEVSAEDPYVDPGKTLALSAAVYQNGESHNSGVNWAVTGGNGTAKIDENGILTVDKTEVGGTTLTVTATSQADARASGTCTVTVSEYAVTVTAADDNVDAGDKLQFTATVTRNGDADPSGVTWSVSGGTGTNTIDADGLLSVDANETRGETLTVTATSEVDGKVSGSCGVTVNKYEVTVSAANNATDIDRGKTLQFTATVTKNGVADTTIGVNWAVDGSTGASIDEDGLLTIAADSIDYVSRTVTATCKEDDTASGSYDVAVNNYSVTVGTKNNVAATVDAGDTLEFTATVAKNGMLDTTAGVTWSVSGGNGTAKIDESGILTVDASETRGATLTVTATSKNDPARTDSRTATVNKYAVTVSEKNSATTVDAGDTLQFTASVTKNGASDSSGVNWSVSGGNNTATISTGGILTVDASEVGGTKLTVKATSQNDSNATNTYTVTVNKYAVTVSAANDATEVTAGDTLQFTAKLTKNGVTDSSGVTWTVTGSNGSSTIDQKGLLTVGSNEAGTAQLTVTATSKNDKKVSNSLTVTANKYIVTVTAASETVDVGYTAQFSATVTKNGVVDNSGVIWEVNSTAGSTINESGVLSVPDTEKHDAVLTVTARAAAAETVVGTCPITVYNGYELLKSTDAGSISTVRIDNMEWYVLAKENGKALIWAAHAIPGTGARAFDVTETNTNKRVWAETTSRAYLNNDFLPTLNVLKNHVVEATIYTAEYYDRGSSACTYEESTDNVFLLSEADVFGTAYNRSTTDDTTTEPKEYTLGRVGIIVTDEMRNNGSDTWLRSPGGGHVVFTAMLGSNGELKFWQYYTGYRPAMWVELTTELEMRLYYDNNFSTVRNTVENGDNAETCLANGWATQIRIYDKDGNHLAVDNGVDLTFWIDGTNVTGGGSDCTNGYDATNRHWWVWVGSSNNGKIGVTVKVAYKSNTFEATIW